jgi:hypothetical protein
MKFLSTFKGKLTFAGCCTIIVGATGFLANIQSIFIEKPPTSVIVDEIKRKEVENSIPYQELSNSKLAQKHVGAEIEIEATYLGLWNLEQIYGIKFPENVITLNHRDISYSSQSTPLGSSDLASPEFALTVPTELTTVVLKLKSYSKIRVKGTVQSFKNSYGKDVVVLAASQITPNG